MMATITREDIRNTILPGEKMANIRFLFMWLVDEARETGCRQFDLTPAQLKSKLLFGKQFPLVQSLEVLQSQGIIFLKKKIVAGRVKKVSIALKMELAQTGQKNSA